MCLGPLSSWNVGGSKFLSRMSQNIFSFILPSLISSFAFTFQMCLVWHLGNEAPCYSPSVGTEPADINLHWCEVSGLLLLLIRFQLVSWLAMSFYTSLSSCAQYFLPVSFHSITHNFIYGHVWFDVFVCVVCMGSYWLTCHVNITCEKCWRVQYSSYPLHLF